jgi:hypothetical protein
MEERMASTHVDIEDAAWTPGTPFYGPAAAYRGKDIIQLKVLSDADKRAAALPGWSRPRRHRES